MKTSALVAIVAICTLSVAGCASADADKKSAPNSPTATRSLPPINPSFTACSSLVGKTVEKGQECSISADEVSVSGDTGCADPSIRVMWNIGSTASFYGKIGGVWIQGPGNMPIGEMNKKVGC